MKFKNLARIGGGVEAAVGIYMCQYAARALPLSYSILEDSLSGNCPPEYSALGTALGAAIVAVDVLALPVCGAVAADGLTDVVTGRHHYFGMRVWRKLTKNKKTTDGIDKHIEKETKLREQSISLKEILSFRKEDKV